MRSDKEMRVWVIGTIVFGSVMLGWVIAGAGPPLGRGGDAPQLVLGRLRRSGAAPDAGRNVPGGDRGQHESAAHEDGDADHAEDH
jgi:hypothetical protein